MTLEKLLKYRPIQLASEYARDESPRGSLGVKYSLNKLNDYLDLGADGKILLKKAAEDERGQKIIINAYAEATQNARDEVTMGEMFAHYQNRLKPYFKEETWNNKVKAYESIKDEKYGIILEKIAQAQEVISSKTNRWSEEDKRKAIDEIKKYQKYIVPLQDLENDDLTKMKSEVDVDVRKELYEELL